MTMYDLREILSELIRGFKHYCFIFIIVCSLGIVSLPGIIGCYVILKWFLNFF